ncbi:ATP-dependent DNA helicase PIF1-like protein [Tanacetum coccineum]
MQATVRMTLVNQFKDRLKEESAVTLKRYSLGYKSITSLQQEEDGQFDMIGHVVACKDLDNYDKNGKSGKKKPLTLVDHEGNELQCTLWSAFSQQFSDFLSTCSDGKIIMVLQLEMMKMWDGNTKTLPFNYVFNCLKNSTKESFVSKFPPRVIAELLDVAQGVTSVIVGTIIAIHVEEDWWYIGCKVCKKKVIRLADMIDLEADVPKKTSSDLIISDDEKKNIFLFYIEDLMRSRGSSFRYWPEMPYPDTRYLTEFGNRLIYDATDYNPVELQSEHERLYVSLTAEQKGVYDTIMHSVDTGTGDVYFLYGYGGTGKTFLWKTLAAGIRRRGDIVLNVASSAPMANKLCFEALDHSLQDILRKNRHDICAQPFGNMTMVFGGDFRQVLPVIPKGSRQDIVIRDGELGEPNDGEVSIDLPEEILADTDTDPVTSIVDFTYPNILDNINDPSYFQEKAIFFPTNDVVDSINEHLLEKFLREEMVYLSCDSVDKTERNAAIDQSIFSPEFINGLKFSGVPNYRLALKVGVPIMLLRNIDQPNGLCNGTRLQVLKLTRTSISAQIINDTHFGKMVIIPRLRITPSDKRLPLKIVRKQFPISLSFAMTINKSQGQSLSKVGLYLPRPVFKHGQLYVVVSRVKSTKGLKVVVFDPDGNISKTTTNVVYKEVLQGL